MLKMENEKIEITPKERTALSILHGLRQKFSIESRKNPQVYGSLELYRLFRDIMEKINRNEIQLYERDKDIQKVAVGGDKVWDFLGSTIERSKIKRYNWDKVFGRSLTQEILILMNQGKEVDETFKILSNRKEVLEFIGERKQKNKILENLKISVYARYGENKTSKKIRENLKGKGLQP